MNTISSAHRNVGEAVGCVASLACRPERSAMLVVGRMAGDAAGRLLDPPLDLCLVTARAIESAMLTGQPEISLNIVIESPFRPVDRRVARRAIRPQPAFVHVILAMAGDTCGVRIEKRC